MQGQDVERAWQYFQFNWIPIALMGVALSGGLMLTNFRIGLTGALVTAAFVAVYAGFAYANTRSPTRRDPQVMFCLGSTAQLVLITALMTPLTYVAGTANFPLQDANLLAVDRAFGLDWIAYATFVNDHPILATWLGFGYTMIRWPLFLIPALAGGRLSLSAHPGIHLRVRIRTDRHHGYLRLRAGDRRVPAHRSRSRHPEQYRLARLSRIPARLRAGAGAEMRTLDLLSLAGIVYFPSFHAGSAILYAWAFWPIRWMRPIALFANGAMIAATPVHGAHYFIDIVAGIALAVLSIVAAKAMGRWLATHSAAVQPKETLAVT